MTSIGYNTFLLLSLIGLIGCNQFNENAYIATVYSGGKAVPSAVEIERLFGDSDHFITRYGFAGKEVNQWNTEVFLYGRYRLHMTVDVKVDYSENTVEQMGEPEFRIFETDRVYDVDEPGDLRGTDVGNQEIFSKADWDLIVDSDGDFSKIGFPLTRDSPVPGYDVFVDRIRSRRTPISLAR